MTAVSKKTNNRFTYKKPEISHRDIAPLLIYFFISAGAAKASWADVSLAGLTVVLISSCRNSLEQVAATAGSALSLLVLSASDRFYIPYFIGCVLYTVMSNTVRNKNYTLAISLVSVAVGKVFLVYSAYSIAYKLLALLEGMALYIIAQIVNNSRELVSKETKSSFADVATVSVIFLVLFLSAAGFDSHWLYTGRAAALAASWLYVQAGMYSHSILCVLCMLVTVSAKAGFVYMFIVFTAIWAAGAVMAEKLSVILYPLAVIAAFAGNIVFIAELGGFGITGTVIMALIIYTTVPHITDIKRAEATHVFASHKDYRQLMISLKKLEDSLNFLGNCAVDIFRLNEKNLSDIPLEDMVAEDICRRCENHSYCWQEKYSFTQSQLRQYAAKINWRGENRFDPGFYVQCRHTDKLRSSFDENSRLLLSRKYMLQSHKNSQKLLQNTFLAVAATVGDVIANSHSSCLVDTTSTMQMDRFLSELDICHTYCLCSRNPDKMSFAVLNPVSESDLYKIRRKLENICGTKFADPSADRHGTEIIYTFHCRPVFSYEYSISDSPYRNINGDSREIFEHSGILYILLSDGMGTGGTAAAESRTALAMAKQLICTGIDVNNVLNIVNLALNLKDGGESGATLDILQIDLFTGKTALTKAGAGVSFVINRDNLTRYYKDSLPLGLMKDIKLSEDNFNLTVNDTVVLASDGVGNISSNLRNMYSQTCEEIAKYVINENNTMDDKTAVAVRLKLNGV